MLLTDKTSPIFELIEKHTHAATMWDHRSLASPPPPDSGGDRSRVSENQVSHTPRRFSNQLEPSS
jgi:hypothetical protein